MLPDLQVTLILLFYVLYALAVIAAVIWGGMPEAGEHAKRGTLRRLLPFDGRLGPERLAAIILTFMFAVRVTSSFVVYDSLDAIDPGAVLVDVIGVIGFLALVRTSTSWWTIWPAALQSLALISHFPRGPLPIDLFGEYAYGFMKSGLTLGAIIAVLVGIVLHQRRIFKDGYYLFWRDQTLWQEFADPAKYQAPDERANSLEVVR